MVRTIPVLAPEWFDSSLNLFYPELGMKRYLFNEISNILSKKLVLLTGPRQVGKTTLSKSISDSREYLNYDRKSDRAKIIKENWDESKELLILDEIHKMKKWKLWLKGIYDTSASQKILVTGSARLDVHKKVGDSMAGRYFQYHLFPLDLKELHSNDYKNTDNNFEKLMLLSGFPEPFMSDSVVFYKKWRHTHLDVIVKQDIIETETLKRISDLESLLILMTERIGSIFSYSSLKEDLMTDEKTVKRWMNVLENAYVFFKITPYSRSIKGSIRKAPKYYFYDFPRIKDEGAKLENFVALSLWKEIHYRNDVLGEDYSLYFLRNKKKEEVDFLITNNKKPLLMIEVKMSDSNPSDNFDVYKKTLIKINPDIKCVQLVANLKNDFISKNGVSVHKLSSWLEKMPLP